jgi:hypothetical protein
MAESFDSSPIVTLRVISLPSRKKRDRDFFPYLGERDDFLEAAGLSVPWSPDWHNH